MSDSPRLREPAEPEMVIEDAPNTTRILAVVGVGLLALLIAAATWQSARQIQDPLRVAEMEHQQLSTTISQVAQLSYYLAQLADVARAGQDPAAADAQPESAVGPADLVAGLQQNARALGRTPPLLGDLQAWDAELRATAREAERLGEIWFAQAEAGQWQTLLDEINSLIARTRQLTRGLGDAAAQ